MAELYRCGVSTVLTADTNVEVLVNGSTKGHCHVHKLTNTGGVKLSEGIVLKDLYYTLAKKERVLFISIEKKKCRCYNMDKLKGECYGKEKLFQKIGISPYSDT